MTRATTLRLGPGFTMPEEAVTRSFAVLGMKGSGKSNAAVVMAEEMYRIGLHWLAIDPKGDWWGLRSMPDGRPSSLKVVIFGGEHGDVPLEPTARAGVIVADTILNEELTCVLDLSEFTKAEKIAFLAGRFDQEGFAERLFRKKKRDAAPLHVFMEEAHDYVPQKPDRDEGKLIATISKLQTMGRQKGFGCSVLSQRSARVHKDVLTQCDVLVAMRVIAPQDRDAVAGWLKFHGERDEILAELATLPNGTAWVWSPEWLARTERVDFRLRTTYDSGSTPIRGMRKVTVSTIDIPALREQMAAAVEKAKATDPAELTKRIKLLERQLNQATTAKPSIEPAGLKEIVKQVEVVKEVPVLTDAQITRIERAVEKAWEVVNKTNERLAEQLGRLTRPMIELVEEAKQTQRRIPTPDATGTERAVRPRDPGPDRNTGGGRPAERPTARPSVSESFGEADVKIGKGENKVMAVLRQWPDGRTYNELAFLTRYSAKASTLGVILSKLRQAGYIEPGNQPVRLTAAGVEAVGGYDIPPTGDALLQHWLSHPRMGEGERRVLLMLIEQYPADPSNDELAELTGYSPTASTLGVILSKLRKLGLVETGHRRLASEFADAIKEG